MSFSFDEWKVDSHLLAWCFFFFQAEDGIRDLVRSRGLGDVYKRQPVTDADHARVLRESVGTADLNAYWEQTDWQEWPLSLIHI